ncbi:Uncharacterised protein [Mycobacteroides abscessus subsp. abscessus]|nr:Uncharacterised protein [Mycobacteroides abscessus subsp. abscessus]
MSHISQQRAISHTPVVHARMRYRHSALRIFATGVVTTTVESGVVSFSVTGQASYLLRRGRPDMRCIR